MNWATLSRTLLTVAIIGMGCLHIFRPGPFERIVPPYLPSPRMLVLMSGAFEITFGAGLVFPVTRMISAYGLLALFIAVFPANIEMAVHPKPWISPKFIWLLWARLPLQIPLLFWAWCSRH